ncbi:MAG: hypothetical protein M3011_00405 [Actinomycetota bacterium]|nr:hypothetical protein [Actinomycetota bacterium]
MVTHLAEAATRLWGPAGGYLYAAYDRLREQVFPDLPAELPMVIGLTAYGHCIGLTRSWPSGARISVAPKVFAEGERMVDDVLVHEMLHVSLIGAGKDPKHAGDSWYAEIRRLSPAVLGRELDVDRPKRRSVRIPNPSYGPDDRRRTLVRKVSQGSEGVHAAMARWPTPFRPAGYDFGPPIATASY